MPSQGRTTLNPLFWRPQFYHLPLKGSPPFKPQPFPGACDSSFPWQEQFQLDSGSLWKGTGLLVHPISCPEFQRKGTILGRREEDRQL